MNTIHNFILFINFDFILLGSGGKNVSKKSVSNDIHVIRWRHKVKFLGNFYFNLYCIDLSDIKSFMGGDTPSHRRPSTAVGAEFIPAPTE